MTRRGARPNPPGTRGFGGQRPCSADARYGDSLAEAYMATLTNGCDQVLEVRSCDRLWKKRASARSGEALRAARFVTKRAVNCQSSYAESRQTRLNWMTEESTIALAWMLFSDRAYNLKRIDEMNYSVC